MCGCWCCRVQSTVQLDRVRLQRPSLKWLLVQLHPCPLSDSGFWLPCCCAQQYRPDTQMQG